MSSPKSMIKRKAAKAVVTHTAHGAVSKVRRKPARAVSLLSAGAVLGAIVGYLVGSRKASAPAAATAPTPVRETAPASGPAVTPVGASAA